jgi:hypothetical protein
MVFYEKGDIVKCITRNKYSVTNYDIPCIVIEDCGDQILLFSTKSFPEEKWSEILEASISRTGVYLVDKHDFVLVSGKRSFSTIKKILVGDE